eukprot:CAMPEP_0176453312 /NCGR_PEP_ID=MMETSP0127-20121128/29149_1 /TAXON_ID=938130 /ORGANISM="Platyophrya macrostoma, Strain WH" /LENGTH=246 /DNA_ID=CAMNT_0017842119 /DNA_START=54 /DNA_END=794 /DNA_ORIENTATION=+
MCQFSLFSVLPTLQPLYTNYKSANWVGLQKNIENLIPAAQVISQNCLNKTFLSSTLSQNCMKSIFTVAGLITPLTMQLNNSQALVNLVNNFGNSVKMAYQTCYLDLAFANNADVEYVDIEEDMEFFSWGDMNLLQCINDLAGTVPLMTAFVQDVKDKKGFDAISGDLREIIGKVNLISTDCGIPKPQGKSGPVDVQKCMLDAETLSTHAYKIVDSIKSKNIFGAIDGVQHFFVDLPVALTDCGLIA